MSLFILCITTYSVSGQSRDFQSRAGIDVSMDFNKDLSGSLEVQQRFRDNSLRFDRSLLTASLSYDLPKGFSLEGGARYIYVQNTNQTFESRFRVHGDVNYRLKLSSFDIKFRERMQYGLDNFASSSNGNKLTNRSRVGLDYDIFGTPISLYTSFEVYLVLNDPTSAIYSLNKVMAGMTWKFPKRMNLKLYYLLEDEVNTVYPKQAHIVVAALGLKL